MPTRDQPPGPLPALPVRDDVGAAMKVLRVLIACEYSGRVRSAFRAIGHDAWSCDLEPSADSSPYHFHGDVRERLTHRWDLVIAFPPCTHLSSSGGRHWPEKRADGRQQAAMDFFLLFTKLRCAWAIENPVGIMSSAWHTPNQIIQPYQFGDAAKKNNMPMAIPSA